MVDPIIVTPDLPSIHDAPLTNYPALIAVLARSSARKVVEERMRNEGKKALPYAEREARDRARKRQREMKRR